MVHVLLSIYKIRKQVLCLDGPLLDFRSKKQEPMYIPISELTSMVKHTRTLLKNAMFESFFVRYTKRREINKCSFLFEMCLFFDPVLKSLVAIEHTARACNLDLRIPEPEISQNVRCVMDRINSNIRRLLIRAAKSMYTTDNPNSQVQTAHLNSDLLEAYEEYGHFSQIPRTANPDEAVLNKVDDEIEKWKNDTVEM